MPGVAASGTVGLIRSSPPARATTARPGSSSAASASRRTTSGPRRTARSTKPSRRSASPAPSLASRRQHGSLNPGLVGLADLILRFQRELFVAAAELATNPDAWDRLVDGQTRRSRAAMVDGVDAVAPGHGGADHDAARVRGAGRDAAQRRARDGPHDPPARGTAGRHAAARGIDPGRPPATVPEPPRGPALGPGTSGRAGRGANRDAVTDRRSARPTDTNRTGAAHPWRTATEPHGVRRHEPVSAATSTRQVGLPITGRRPARRAPVGRASSARPSRGCSRACCSRPAIAYVVQSTPRLYDVAREPVPAGDRRRARASSSASAC